MYVLPRIIFHSYITILHLAKKISSKPCIILYYIMLYYVNVLDEIV